MPITGTQVPVSADILELAQAIAEILRRGVDGTVVPLFVDAINQRIIVGATAASSNPAKAEISGGDIKVVDGGSGVIIPTRSGNSYYRLLMEEDGTISADLVV